MGYGTRDTVLPFPVPIKKYPSMAEKGVETAFLLGACLPPAGAQLMKVVFPDHNVLFQLVIFVFQDPMDLFQGMNGASQG